MALVNGLHNDSTLKGCRMEMEKPVRAMCMAMCGICNEQPEPMPKMD